MHPSTSIARSRRLLLVVAASAVVVGLCLAAVRAAAQTGTSDGPGAGGSSGSVTVTTTVDLVHGSVDPTTTTSTIAAAVTKADHSAKKHTTTNWKVWAIVAGLVLVAVLMGVLTWRYWTRTRPAGRGAARKGTALTVNGIESAPAATADSAGRRGRGGRRESRYANLEISLPAHPSDESSDPTPDPRRADGPPVR